MTPTEENMTATPKKLGRPKNPERWNSDGSASKEFINAYFEKHYHKPHTCEICGRTRKCSDNIVRHQKSARCLKAKMLLEKMMV